MGAKELGKICLIIILELLAPSALAASIYSFSFIDNMELLNNRATDDHPKIPIAIKTFNTPGPKTVMITIAPKIYGKAKKISAILIITASDIPPKNPDNAPRNSPIAKEIATATTPTSMEILVPYNTLLKISLSKISVPNQCCRLGPFWEASL